MGKHNIHGIEVTVEVFQGNLTDVSRGRCVGKVVNLLREMDAEEFRAAMENVYSKANAAMLSGVDAALESGYTKRGADDFAPIASINVA